MINIARYATLVVQVRIVLATIREITLPQAIELVPLQVTEKFEEAKRKWNEFDQSDHPFKAAGA